VSKGERKRPKWSGRRGMWLP